MPHQVALQPLIDAMTDHVAVVARGGVIISVNKAWREFGAANGGDQGSHYVGENYLQICRESSGDGAELAARVEDGISRVLEKGEEFSAEYPCHCAAEKRWFRLIGSPLEIGEERYALLAHRNVTAQKLSRSEVGRAEQDTKNLAAIIATLPDAVIAFDMDGCITSWNPAAQKLYGYERDEVLGKSMEILYPPDWPKRIQDYIAEIVVDKLDSFEAVRVTRAGQPRTVEISAAPIRAPSGEVVGVSNVHRDVTGLREAYIRSRRILDQLFSFVGVLDIDGTLIEANRAPLEAAELDETDVIGKKFWDCYWWSYSPQAQERLKQDCERARAGEVVRHDVEVRVAGGQLLWIDFQIAPMFNSAGEVENLIPSGIDISERMAATENLRTSHDAFKAIVDRSPFGVYTVDSDFRLAHVSEGAQKAFANVHPVIGHDFADALRILWPESFASEAIERFRHTLATGEPYRSPHLVEQRQDIGEVESYDWMIERITMPDGRPGVVCNFYDLSEREKYDEHIRLLMREVNHRAKNLLTIVISMARQTARDASPGDFVQQFSQRVLGLSASQDLIVQHNWEGVTVRELVRSQLRHLGPDMLEDRVELEGPDILITPASAQGIGMALHELSTNALKYGALSVAGGVVAIAWGTDPDADTFSMHWVERDGPAVSPPQTNGFGRTVIEKMAAASVNGEVDIRYDPAGVAWTLTAPLSTVTSTAETG